MCSALKKDQHSRCTGLCCVASAAGFPACNCSVLGTPVLLLPYIWLVMLPRSSRLRASRLHAPGSVKSVDLNTKVTVYSCMQVMALQEENLAYLAEHDPARALQEYRRRKAAIPQQTVHAPVPKQEEKSSSAPSTEVKHHLRVRAFSMCMQTSSACYCICSLIRKQWQILNVALLRSE